MGSCPASSFVSVLWALSLQFNRLNRDLDDRDNYHRGLCKIATSHETYEAATLKEL